MNQGYGEIKSWPLWKAQNGKLDWNLKLNILYVFISKILERKQESKMYISTLWT